MSADDMARVKLIINKALERVNFRRRQEANVIEDLCAYALKAEGVQAEFGYVERNCNSPFRKFLVQYLSGFGIVYYNATEDWFYRYKHDKDAYKARRAERKQHALQAGKTDEASEYFLARIRRLEDYAEFKRARWVEWKIHKQAERDRAEQEAERAGTAKHNKQPVRVR